MNKPEKFILDATAGFRMMWFNKQHPNALYIDERKEVNPDIVADYRNMKDFADSSFQLIVWDPPHIIRKPYWDNTAEMEKNFGWLNFETWQSDLKRGFAELWRCLKPNGVLIFKWSEYSATMKKVLKLFPIDPLFYQITAKKITSKKKESRTLWFCFMKIPEEKK